MAKNRIKANGLLCPEIGEHAAITDVIPKPTHLGAAVLKMTNRKDGRFAHVTVR